eukprot:GHVO01044225.1.p1 GENE.GHVO01044225.1~~GHVO01044225.1.p1  ORF type:complete len:183 (+),score=27.61 GHVO01044225.1:43-591(+)
MSKKYFERVSQGHSIAATSLKVESKFGKSILAKFGWKDGDGLGASRSGETKPIQITKREQGLGLGAEKANVREEQWTNWWDNQYDQIAQKLAINCKVYSSDDDSSDGDSGDESSKNLIVSSSRNKAPEKMKRKREKLEIENRHLEESSNDTSEKKKKRKKTEEKRKSKKSRKMCEEKTKTKS